MDPSRSFCSKLVRTSSLRVFDIQLSDVSIRRMACLSGNHRPRGGAQRGERNAQDRPSIPLLRLFLPTSSCDCVPCRIENGQVGSRGVQGCVNVERRCRCEREGEKREKEKLKTRKGREFAAHMQETGRPYRRTGCRWRDTRPKRLRRIGQGEAGEEVQYRRSTLR